MRHWGRSAAAVLTVVLVAACTSTPAVLPTPTPVVSVAPVPSASGKYSSGAAGSGDSLLPAEGDGGYDARHYGLTIGYTPASRQLTGDEVLTAVATQDLFRFDLDFHGLTVTSVTIDGVPATWARAGDKLQVTPLHGLDAGVSFTAHIVYRGVPSDYSDAQLGFEGFAASGPGALAQGEPLVASTWYPVNEHPSDKATYDITVTAPSTLSALSNGVLVAKTAAGTTTTWHWRENAPMASYLAMVAIGRYRVVTSTHDGLPVVLAVDASLPMSVDATLARTPEILDFLETQFGPYPFDAIGGIVHDDPRFRFALENQTRPVYSAVFFKNPGDHTYVIAHELAHEWYGDSVSLSDWKDLWLNEGFATYAEWLWAAHEGAKTVKQSFDAVYGQPMRPGLDTPPGRPTLATLFGDSVYDRGAEVLQALRVGVGDTAFFTILRTWASRYRFGNATTADFIAVADQVSGKSCDALLKAWLYGTVTPPYPSPLS